MKICKIIIMLVFILISLEGCAEKTDLGKYGINDGSIVETQAIENLDNKEINNSIIENDESNSNVSENINKNIEENSEENISKEYKYPISKYIKKELISKNEIYLNDIIEILNSQYYLGNDNNILEREKAEIQDKLKNKINEYYNFIVANNMAYEKIDNGYETYILEEYLNKYYLQNISHTNLDIEEIEAQKYIDEFISKITMLNYSDIANLRSNLRGKSVYSPSDILSVIYTNKKVEQVFIYENEYEDIVESYNKDFYYTTQYMKLNLLNNKSYGDDIINEINDYIDTYEKWIKSFKESESIINNERRYYNEEKQILLYDNLINKLDNLKNNIN